MDNPQSRAMRIIKNPKKVFHQFQELMKEWYSWRDQVAEIKDHEYDRQRQSEVYADGEENMQWHMVLQEKTLTFLDNNVENHGFVYGVDNSRCDRTDLRLAIRVKHRLEDLEIIKGRLEYAKVPDSFWLEKGKELVTSITTNPDKAIETAANALKLGL